MVNIEYKHDENDPLLDYLYNRETFSVNILSVKNMGGIYTLQLSNCEPHNCMPYYDVYISPTWLDRNNLKQLIYFLGEILSEWSTYVSLSDYDDEELLVIANGYIEKLSLLSSVSNIPSFRFSNHIKISEDIFEVQDGCINMEELIDWANKATKLHILKIGKRYGIL